MRSMFKVTGIVLAATLGLSLAACSSAPEAFDASTVSCETVVDAVASAETSLKDAKATLTDGKGTPAETSAKADVDAAQSELDALNERADKCNSETDVNLAGDIDIELTDELRDLLDATYATPGVCPAIVQAAGGAVVQGYYDLLLKALYAVDENGDPEKHLKWSDALSTYLPGNTPAEKYESLKVAICTEPVVGVALAHLFAHLEVGDTRVLELQTTDWLDKYNVSDKKINDLVANFFPNFNVKEEDRDDVSDQAALDAMTEYQSMADNLLYLLSRYQLVDVRAIDSTHHYHQVAGGLAADGIPEIEVSSDLDSRPALVFFLTEKTACVPISVLAFNVGDKRPELGAIPADCTPFVPPTPGCQSDCGGTPPPGCVTNCGGDGKTGPVPHEEGEKPAPPPSGPAGPPEVVDTTPVDTIDTNTDLPPQDTGGSNTGVVTD